MKEMDELVIKAQIDEISDKIDSIIQKINDLEPDRSESPENEDSNQGTV